MEETFKNRFNVAAFLMPQFWSIGNHVWIGLLAFIPILYPFIAIYLGLYGSELAYERGSYYNEDGFYEYQRKWTIASIVYAIVLVLIGYFAFREPLGNYIANKHNLNKVISTGEKAEERLTEEINVLLESKEIKQVLDAHEYTIEQELTFNDDLDSLDNSNFSTYHYLSQGRIEYENPRISSAGIDYQVSNTEGFSLVFFVDDEYELSKVRYVYRNGDTAYVTDPLLSKEQIQKLLKD